MEISVKHTIEFSAATLGAIAAMFGGNGKTAPVTEGAKPDTKKTDDKKPDTKKEEKKEPTFADMSNEDKLAAIQSEVTKHTKKGKSADIKALLGHFEAGRASEMDTAKYDDFYAAIKRYSAGEKVEEIIGGDDLS